MTRSKKRMARKRMARKRMARTIKRRGGRFCYGEVPQTTHQLLLIPIYEVKDNKRYLLHKDTQPGVYRGCIFRYNYFIIDDEPVGSPNKLVHITDTYLQNHNKYKVFYDPSHDPSNVPSNVPSTPNTRTSSMSRGVGI